MKASNSFPFAFAVLTWAIGTSIAAANEPLWTDEDRLENRDLVCLGTVTSVEKISRIDAENDLYLAEIEIAEMKKGPKTLVGSKVNVYYEFSSSGLNKRCPAYAKLPRKEKRTFYLHNLTEEIKRALRLEQVKAPALFLKMDSDVRKEKGPPSATLGSPASFGPVIECALGQLELLDLDTGQKAAPIAQGEPKQEPHLDVYLDFGADAQNRSFPMLVSQFLYAVRATNWDVSADELEAALRTNGTPPRVRVLAKPQDSLPVTYWFRTRAGNLGTLQVLGFGTKPPEEVGIRYRLLKTKQ